MTANVSYLALVVINFTRAQKREMSRWVDLQEDDMGEQHSPQAGARGKSCAGQKTWSCRRLEKRLATPSWGQAPELSYQAEVLGWHRPGS